MTAAKKLRELLKGNATLIAPGAYDTRTARLIAESGVPVVYMTGYGVSASVLGKPDIGLITLKEMARNIVDASGGTPVIADADNGYGGLMNAMRTVALYEQAGVAAIQLPHRHLPGFRPLHRLHPIRLPAGVYGQHPVTSQLTHCKISPADAIMIKTGKSRRAGAFRAGPGIFPFLGGYYGKSHNRALRRPAFSVCHGRSPLAASGRGFFLYAPLRLPGLRRRAGRRRADHLHVQQRRTAERHYSSV